MSFRVKATHPLLKPTGPPPETTTNFFTSSDEKKMSDNNSSFMTESSMFDSKNVSDTRAENRPKGSNQKGMAIRTVPSAQPDYM